MSRLGARYIANKGYVFFAVGPFLTQFDVALKLYFVSNLSILDLDLPREWRASKMSAPVEVENGHLSGEL